MIRAMKAGEVGTDGGLDDRFFDDRFVDLLDATMIESAPGANRVLAILEERAGKAGPASSEYLPAHSTLSSDPPRSTHQRCGRRQNINRIFTNLGSDDTVHKRLFDLGRTAMVATSA